MTDAEWRLGIAGGASLTANIALVRNNARLGAAIAQEYAALRG